MHQQGQQIRDEHPEAVRSDPVPVPAPPATGTDPDRKPPDREDPDRTMVDREDPDRPVADREDPDREVTDSGVTERGLDSAATNRDTEHGSVDHTATGHEGRTDADEETGERVDGREFHEPANQPTAFGAGTVGGAVAAAALASGVRADERDARDEETVQPGNGAVTDGTADRAEQGTVNGSAVGVGGTLPGGVPAEPVTALIPATTAREFRDRWREVQLRFVDDPRAAATQARELAEEAIDAMTAALARQRDELSGWQQHESRDTEQLRIAVRRYRELLDRMLGD